MVVNYLKLTQDPGIHKLLNPMPQQINQIMSNKEMSVFLWCIPNIYKTKDKKLA